MVWRSGFIGFWRWLILLILFAVFGGASARAELEQENYIVRIPASEQIDNLALRPLMDIDYGSFRWLELDALDFVRLTESGISFTELPDSGHLQIMDYHFDPRTQGEPAYSSGLQVITPGFRLIQLIGPPKNDWLGRLQDRGLVLLQYINHQTMLQKQYFPL